MSSPAVHDPSSTLIRAALGRRGFTFVELIVVMAVLTVLAGLVLYKAGDTTAQTRVDATVASAISVRDAICGTQGAPGFLNDLGEVPIHLADLFDQPLALPSGKPVQPFDRFTGRGWHGPYLMRNTGRYRVAAPSGFTSFYGQDGDPAVIDPWGRPIVLQWPIVPAIPLDARQSFVRLVSAGPDGIVNTPSNVLAPDLNDAKQVGDDVVVYLFRANGP
jgi:prepilin-type N-terminal cleavage/methylation domain-containing protein